MQGQPPLILHELEDATTAAMQLELVAGVEIPKLLKAAAKVLERASLTEGNYEFVCLGCYCCCFCGCGCFYFTSIYLYGHHSIESPIRRHFHFVIGATCCQQ
jgi:hypothetical protein